MSVLLIEYSLTHLLYSLTNLAPSTAPMSVTVTSITSTSFLFSWIDPPPVDHNGLIRNYTIVISELNTGNVVQLVSQTTSQVFDSLHPDYNYSVEVAAVTVATGPFSPALTVSTLEDGRQYLLLQVGRSMLAMSQII